MRGLLAALLLWLLVGPRIELPVVPGARVEDLVFAVLAVVCLAHGRRRGTVRGVTLAVGGVVAAGVVSAGVAAARGTVDPVTAVLFAVRPLEYWVAFPAALLLLRSADGRWTRRVDVLLVVVTVLQTAFAVAQYYFDLPIGFSHAAYTRAAGLTVGPYELGAISAALVVYWVAHRRFTMASLATIALAASISRVSLLAAAVGIAVLAVAWGVRQTRRAGREGWRRPFRVAPGARARLVLHVLSVAAAAVVLAFTLGLFGAPAPTPGAAAATSTPGPSTPVTGVGDDPAGESTAAPTASAEPAPDPGTSQASDEGDGQDDGAAEPTAPPVAKGPTVPSDSIGKRLATTSILGSWQKSEALADAAPTPRTSAQYVNTAYAHLNDYVNATNAATSGSEASNLVRFFRWHLILNTIDDPVDVLFGLGPSFVGPSVDGSFLRMYAEGGLLGVLAWGALVVAWFRRSPLWMTCVTLSLLIGGLFIDIVYAQRPMVLFWLLLALALTRRERAAAESESPMQEAEGPAASSSTAAAATVSSPA